MGYYMQGGDKMHINYNHSDHDKYSFNNNKIYAFYKMPDIQNMPYSEKKSPPFPVNDKKTPISRFLIGIRRGGFPSYKTAEEFMSASNFINMLRSIMLLLFMRN